MNFHDWFEQQRLHANASQRSPGWQQWAPNYTGGVDWAQTADFSTSTSDPPRKRRIPCKVLASRQLTPEESEQLARRYRL